MPKVEITMKTRSLESRKLIAKGVTEVIAREANVDPNKISVYFQETNEEMVARGGILLSEINQPKA